jgi:energy-coupling factor transporter ATP-binding protein EcfA2
MPDTIHKVFISSPGDLDSERAECKAAIQKFNLEHADRNGPYFLAVDWKDFTPQGAVAQKALNNILRSCDFCVLMVHEKWGSQPCSRSQYSCGTEEEFAVACRQHRRRCDPRIRNIAVFFKRMSSTASRTAAAARIRDFQALVQSEYFTRDFSELHEFADIFRQLLDRWRDEARDEISHHPTPRAAGRRQLRENRRIARKEPASSRQEEQAREIALSKHEAIHTADWEIADNTLKSVADFRRELRAGIEEELGHLSYGDGLWAEAIRWYEKAIADYKKLKNNTAAKRVRFHLGGAKSLMNRNLAPCIAVIGPPNAGKSTLLNQLDHILQPLLKAFTVIEGSPDHTGRYPFHAPAQRALLKTHVKGKWSGAGTVDHIRRTIDLSRQNLELCLLDFGGKHDDANPRMLERCSHYIVVSRFNDDEGAASWDALCDSIGLKRIASMRSIGPDSRSAPSIRQQDDVWFGTFRFDARPEDTCNDAALGPLASEIVSLRREPALLPYIDLHYREGWQETDLADAHACSPRISEMTRRTGVVVLGGVAPVWAYLAGLRCALETNAEARIFFFDPKQPQRLVEIPKEHREGPWPPGLLNIRWNTELQPVRLELEILSPDRFLPPEAAENLPHAPHFGSLPAHEICLWGRAPLWLYGTYARWLIGARVLNLSSWDPRKDAPVQVYFRH